MPLLVSAKRKGIVYDFHTIDDPTVNAFAIPGSHIFFFRGILEAAAHRERAQLAGVLAHGINHVDKRHTIAIFEYLRRSAPSRATGPTSARSWWRGATAFSTTQEGRSRTPGVKFL
ncbi:MAG: M48 family metalloprotease, partial [Polyangiaceae bacterium]|nr:M48 family metalloprotease [Polyangiaceae bacterium]